MSNKDNLLRAVSNMTKETKLDNILKLEWDEDESELVFKVLKEGGFSYTPVVSLNLERDKVVGLLNCMYECIREAKNVISELYGNYDISINTALKAPSNFIELSIMECVGQKSKPLCSMTFTGYMSGKTLLEGIRKFRADNELY